MGKVEATEGGASRRLPLENMDRAGAVIEAGNAAAGRVRQADLRAFHLARARFAAQLPHDLDHLRRARRAHRMALGEQPARRIDRNAPADAGRAAFQKAAPSPRGQKPNAS